MKPIITITQLASKNLIKLLKKNHTTQALFSVESGGCNGLRYKLEPLDTNNKERFDEKISLDTNYTLNICNKSLFYLLGTKIEWEKDFMGQYFSFNNPNKSSSCGCGQTFNIKE